MMMMQLRKDMELLAWLDEEGRVNAAECDMRKEKLLSGFFDRRGTGDEQLLRMDQ
jgi:hypothetical protein